MSRQVDVSVNIRGNASGLNAQTTGGGGQPPSPVAPSSVTPPNTTAPPRAPRAEDYSSGRTGGVNMEAVLPNQDRMVNDVRREMQARGVVMIPGSSNMAQIVRQVGQSSKENAHRKLDDDFERRRGDLHGRRMQAYDDVEEYIEKIKAQRIAINPGYYNSEEGQSALNEWVEEQRNIQYRLVDQKLGEEEEAIEERYQESKNEVERELTEAIKQLAQYFEREAEDGYTSNSYLGSLREERENIIYERDTAATKEEAMAASERLKEVDDKIREAEGRGGSRDDENSRLFDPVAAIARGGNAFMMSMARGNLGGMIGGAGQAMIGASGMGQAKAAKAGLVLEIIKGLVEITQMDSKVADELGPFAAWMSATGGGGDTRANLLSLTEHQGLFYGEDFGLDRQEFASRAVSVARARGMAGSDWADVAFAQLGLERGFGLEDGTLMRASSYDRYGTNITEALTSLVSVLSGIKGSGVSNEDFTRVNEKLLIQQSVMETYKNISDKPDYHMANKMVAAFSATGVAQDDRLASDIKVFQDMIRNPVNDKMEAIVNDVIAEIHPEARGRLDVIDRYKNDPKMEGEIMSSVLQRIQNWYGGTDTMMGYFAAKDATKGMISPDRLDQYMKTLTPGGAGGQLLNSKEFNYYDDKNMTTVIDRGIGSLSEMTKTMTAGKNAMIEAIGSFSNKLDGIQDSLSSIMNKLTFWN